MTEKKLETMSVKELRSTAKELGIQGRWDMTQKQLIEAIEGATNKVDPAVDGNSAIAEDPAQEEKSARCEESIEEAAAPAVVEDAVIKEEKKAAATDSKVKERYICEMEVGTIVAFRIVVCGVTKVKSAAMENISTKRKQLKLVNKAGVEFIVPFEDIVWVRTGKRWPRGIYEQLKGMRAPDANGCE